MVIVIYNRFIRTVLTVVLLFITNQAFCRGEVKSFPGFGEAPVQSTVFGQAKHNQEALEQAEGLATANAFGEAVKSMFGPNRFTGPELKGLSERLSKHSSTLVKDKVITQSDLRDGKADIQLILRVDMKALTDFLGSEGISLTQSFEGKFKVFVLAFTAEGMDPDRSKPMILRDEIRDDRKNVQDSKHASLQVSASQHSEASSLSATGTSSDQGKVSLQTSSSIDASQKGSAAAKASGNTSVSGAGGRYSDNGSASSEVSQESKLKEQNSASGSADWDRKDSASLDVRSAKSGASYRKNALSGSTFSDTSSYYYRVTDYADPTKKGASRSNDVRAKFEGILQEAGLTVAVMNLPMEGKEFINEDAFLDYVFSKAVKERGVRPDDYFALVLNSLTPVSTTQSEYTAKVTYRIVRVSDRLALIPANTVAKKSEVKASNDEAALQATSLALLSLDGALPGQIRAGLQRLTREDRIRSKEMAGKYIIQLEGIRERSLVAKVRQIFRNAGFTVKSETLSEGRVEVLTLELDRKSPEDVKDLLDTLPTELTLLTKTDQEARLKVQ
jgi:hypothetical protein